MKRTFASLVAAIMIAATASSAQASYDDTIYYMTRANERLAWAWFYGAAHLHWSDYYDYVDMSTIYSALEYASWARDEAFLAWLFAPLFSVAEYWSYETYLQLDDLQWNLWMVYAVQGVDPQYTEGAISSATWGQITSSYAVRAAAYYY